MPSFDTVLIANRGEIASRIARSARALGYRVVGVYSAADRDAPYLDAVDEAVAIGAAPAAESYLSIERSIAAARRTGAGAIHPGYGFLSESSAFAEACVAAGVVWVGPPPAVLRRFGDKAAAKAAMAAAGVPCVPGIAAEGRSDDELAAAAVVLGLPLLVKAAAGGGGRGMRRVERAQDLPAALADSRREVEASFGAGDLLIERALEGVRHVEVQVLFDAHGNGVHLGERDCSAQRRHQKIVEESPSPALGPEARESLGRLALEAARAAGYVGAGTLEFLVDAGGTPYFLEMNPRLQVEHAVTEMVTGLDLVELQLRIAAGEPLPLRLGDASSRGHAIEARLYAEDPDQGFLPQSGTLALWRPAAQAVGVRIDHALRSGVRVPPDYDPLLAKIVGWGRDREEARRRLLRAVERTRALGLVTNKAFLVDLLESEAFVAGEMTTDAVERWQLQRTREREPGVSDGAAASLAPALAALLLSGAALRERGQGGGSGADLPWAITVHDGDGALEVRGTCDGSVHRLTARGATHDVGLLAIGGGQMSFVENGVRRTATFARENDALWLEVGRFSGRWEARTGGAAPRAAAGDDDGALRAPMAAQVVAVTAAAGDRVEAGAALAVLRAMKLEHRITAPRGGRVREVLVREGDQVAFRQILLRLDAVAERHADAEEAGR